MSDILITAPLLVEALAIRSAAPGLRVRTTGMGPERARAAVPALSADPARAMLVLGFGGGLRPDSRLCDVVVAERVVALDEHGTPSGEPICCEGADGLAAALSDCGLQVRRGLVASVDRIITGEARERMLACGALAVDMESAWIAAAAQSRPFSVVRVLSDTPDRELRQRLPVGPPLPTLADAARATVTLRRTAKALAALSRQNRLHTVLQYGLR
ncbi:MAG: phosphorylase family protein [Solirubrobacteraceae bacterium]